MARVRINPADWPRSDGVLIDVLRDGVWANAGLYALRAREIDVEVQSGERIRAAGFRLGDVPHGAPAGVTALLISDYVEADIA